MSQLTSDALLITMVHHIGILLLASPNEAAGRVRKRLVRHHHVALAKLQRRYQQMRGLLEILQGHAARVLARNRHALEMRDEVMLVDRNGVVGVELRG